MDRKFRSDERWFISPVVNVRTFLETASLEQASAQQLLGLSEERDEQQESLKGYLDCSEATLDNVLNDISLSSLIQPESRPETCTWEELNHVNHFNLELKCTRVAHNRYAQFRNFTVKGGYTRKLKYYKFEQFGNNISQFRPDVPRFPTDDVIMQVQLVVPHTRMPVAGDSKDNKRMRPQSKFLVRGETTLYDLRQRIGCVSDLGAYLEPGKELEQPNQSHINVNLYPSSFIFIHDTFYVDSNLPNSVDISVETREFMRRKQCFDDTKVHIGLRDVKIADLTLRLGQPYVFQHCGNCEHLIIFTDLRLMNKDDDQDPTAYPKLLFEQGGDKKCYGCKRLEATMGVEDSTRLPVTPAFFCRECFKEFMYTNGKRQGDFRAFPYYQINRLLHK